MVENPATSTPGLAFMLATVARFGESGWQDYWRRLRANGVLVVDGWEEAYTTRFSGAGGSKGKRPIVVSYATSPAAEVIFAKPPPTTAPTAVVTGSCFRQVELAGVLAGARNAKGAYVDRLHALGAVPGSAARQYVRASGPRRHAAARGVPQVRRLAGAPLELPAARSAATAIAGSTSGRRSSCGEARRAARHDRSPGGVPRPLLRVSARRDPRARPDLGGRAALPAGTAAAACGSRSGRRLVDGAHAGRGAATRVGDGRFRFRGRALARALVLVPFVLPTVVVATAFLALLPDGYERGLWAILAAHVYFNVAVVTRIVGGAWATIDPRSADAAAVLGAGPLRRAREITLPQLAPALSAAAALTFLFCFTSFGVILILGGPGRATLETEIYNQAARLFDLQAAAALSLLQLGAVAIVLRWPEHPRGACRQRGDARRRERRAPPAARPRTGRAPRRA